MIHGFSWVQCFCMLIEATECFEDFFTCCCHNSAVVSTSFWYVSPQIRRNDEISRAAILVFKWVVQHPFIDHRDFKQINV